MPFLGIRIPDEKDSRPMGLTPKRAALAQVPREDLGSGLAGFRA